MSSTTSSSSGDDSTFTKASSSSSSRKRSAEKSGFRKAPGAPKRFKSPYILFSISRMESYREEMGSKTKVTSISKLVSDEWKALPTEERKKWEERARLDKERYNAEKSLYTGPWQVPSKRSRKDPSAPKRPMSAFLFYSQGKRAELKAENPGLKNTDISRLLGERWKQAPESERLPFIEREKKVREVYNRDIAEWRKKKGEEEKAVREHRQKVAEQWIKSGYQTHGSGVAAQVYAPSILAPVNGSLVQVQQPQGYSAILPAPSPAGMTYITPAGATQPVHRVSPPGTMMPQGAIPATVTPPSLSPPAFSPSVSPSGLPHVAAPQATSGPPAQVPTTQAPFAPPPIAMAPVAPSPIAPAHIAPAPTTHAPIAPAPTPTHIAQAPMTHAPIAPAPAPIAQAPMTHAPIAPAPAPIAQAPIARAPVPLHYYQAPYAGAPYTMPQYAPAQHATHAAAGSAFVTPASASVAPNAAAAPMAPPAPAATPSPPGQYVAVAATPYADPAQAPAAQHVFNYNHADAFMIHQYDMQHYQYLTSAPPATPAGGN